MIAVAVIGLLVGLDNLQVGAALGLRGFSAGRRWALAAAFAACETLMPLIGLWGGQQLRERAEPYADALGVAVLALSGLLVLALGCFENEEAPEAEGRAALLVLPISLSFDNLLAGAGLGALGYPVVLSALIIGAISGSLCAFGLFAGDRLRGFFPRQAPWLSGAFLVGLAVYRGLESWA